MPIDYLQKILTAKVYDVAIESPLDLAPTLSRRIGNRVLLKREDQQPVFSFKLRGAYNKMAHLSAGERARGVVAASAGNHAQGVALAAQHLSCKATIVMPVTTPSIKRSAVVARGATVVLHGDSYSDAYAHALKPQRRTARRSCTPTTTQDASPVRARSRWKSCAGPQA
jgi:threonine dehydratase